ncbi:universal stress protein [Streptomyces sp. NPDC050504]|uniref:universal stress protein n=1 Tax=Streptomyces sp. NPDC050504 TaxID=3365618 RepID=UPI0037A4790C
MPLPVCAGVDGSAASIAAAAWAAREAELREATLDLVAAWHWPAGVLSPDIPDAETREHWARRSLQLAVDRLHRHHPHLEIRTLLLPEPPREALLRTARRSQLLALGSRGIGSSGPIAVASTGMQAAVRTRIPVVVTPPPSGMTPRAGEPVLLAVDTAEEPDEVIAFAFEEAAARQVPLRVLCAWPPPPEQSYPALSHPRAQAARQERAHASLAEVLVPWRLKWAGVRVEQMCPCDSPVSAVARAATGVCLAVLGRPMPTGPRATRLGPVALRTLHTAPCPVALVPYACSAGPARREASRPSGGRCSGTV